MQIEINKSSKWATRPQYQKRLNGFASYILAAIVALWNPEAADMAMYDVLSKQFYTKP